MRESLINNFGVPGDAIVLQDQAYSTEQEVALFNDWTKQVGAKKLLDIAPDKHFMTIPQLFRDKRVRVDYKAVENIIEERDPDEAVKRYVRWFRRSRYERNYAAYQLPIMGLMAVDKKYRILTRLAQRERSKPSHPGPPGFIGRVLPVDRYKLPEAA